MSREESKDYVYNPERSAKTHGVVIFLVNRRGEVLYGRQLIDTSRGKKGEKSLIGESREQGGRQEVIKQSLVQELGKEYLEKIVIPDNLREAWLGSVRFIDGVNAQAFCLSWKGLPDEIPRRSSENDDPEANDFIAEGWLPLEKLKQLDLREGMSNVLAQVLENPKAVSKIKGLSGVEICGDCQKDGCEARGTGEITFYNGCWTDEGRPGYESIFGTMEAVVAEDIPEYEEGGIYD